MNKFTKVRKRRILANLYVTTQGMNLELTIPRKKFRDLISVKKYFPNNLKVQVFISIRILNENQLLVAIGITEGFRFDGATAWWDKGILEAALYHDAMCLHLPQEFRPLADEIFHINVAKSTNRFYARLLWLGVVGYRKIRGG